MLYCKNGGATDEFVNEPAVKNCEAKSSKEEPKVVRKNDGAPIIEEWVSDNEEDDVSQTKTEKKIVKPSIAKIKLVKPKQQEKTARKIVKQVEKHRQNIYSPRGNQRNWNNMMSQRLGSNFEMFNKACYVCGSFDHLVNHQNFAKKTHPCAKKNMIPKAVLMKSGLVSVNTDRQVNAAHSKTTVNAARPMENFKTARPKAVVNAVKGNNFNDVKASACWVWKPKHKVLDHVSKHNSASITLKRNPQMDLQDQGVIDSGCSRHMTGNMSYLTYYEEIDGGYVAFGGNPKGGKITGKCTIKTGNLDFENVYFVRELKFNLFSVSQMCDKKNSVLFNDTECIVLSPNFKLIDESQVLLRVPRKNNMYSVDLKNIVPKGGLTCLFAKATSDESKLWHRRLGHLNFKTMNKLVKGNLFWSSAVAKTINGEVQLHALVDGKKIVITEASVRRDIRLEDEEDEVVHKELGDSLVRAATTTSRLEAEQDSVEGSSKRACTELEQEITKKQKVDDVQETTEVDDDQEAVKIKELMEIVPGEEEVAIDAIPLAVKSPSIVDWKIYKEGKKSYYQIIRADDKTQMYLVFSHILKSFDRKDLETLWKLVKARYGSTRPVEDLNLVLWNDLKNMFEPHIEDPSMHIYILVEKKYPLTPPTLSQMLEKKLQIDYQSEMAYQLFKVSAAEEFQ
ncbi:ribonuclease H-like domain-containing protein [Tanacetum coccineum]